MDKHYSPLWLRYGRNTAEQVTPPKVRAHHCDVIFRLPMQASSGWGISVCGHLNSSVTCGPVVPSQVVCSAVFLPYLNHFIPYTVVAHWHSTGHVCITAAMEINNRLKPRRSSSSATCGHLTQLFRPLTQFSRPRYLFGNQPMEVTCSPKPGPAFIL